ncbi:MAG: DUF1816 domain-containing protein [Calothrix sp. MO_167.B12]|nr:DUF1816 domain-containing protein [Calothrix sp. MO_167.B12]
MTLQRILTEIQIDVLEKIGKAWWLEITTQIPSCTYYFGPFASTEAAQFAQSGYIEDLKQEGAQGIAIKIERCQPQRLTICEDL